MFSLNFKKIIRQGTLSCTLAFLFLFLQPTKCIATHIQTFLSDITVTTSGLIKITNTIKYVETEQKKHGIILTLPILYCGPLKTNYRTNLQITEIKRNKKIVPYKKTYKNGKILLTIGSKDVTIQPGLHTYTISYQTERQLQFNEEYDELAWNVTGLESPVSIRQAIARLYLPNQINKESIKVSGFTGKYKSRAKHINIKQKSPYDIIVSTTRPLAPFAGLTIYASWNKGIINRPSTAEIFKLFFRDNPGLFFFFFALLGLIWLFFNILKRIKKYEKPSTIIPRFYPPKNWIPLECGYLKKKSIEPTHIAAEIVHLAINGYLTISLQDRKKYLLTKTKKEWTDLTNPIDIYLLKTLFADGDNYLLQNQSPDETDEKKAQKIIDTIQSTIESHPISKLFKTNSDLIGLFMFAVAGSFVIASFLDGYGSLITLIPGAILFKISLFYFPGYTIEGRMFLDEISGFSMYLKTAEIDRLKTIGTPPTKTPELFEKYLPFAMALGLETAWSKQFAPLFKKWEQAEHPYHPVWFSGELFSIYHLNRMNQLCKKTFVLSNPATSKFLTGRFGGGFSGGGRGGGGISSW